MGDERRKWVQGLAALLGITLGVVPLLQMLFQGRPGLWKFVLGDAPGSVGYVLPAAILFGAIVVVALTEAKK